ncbi:MAG: hypothetical protein ABFD89_06790 [Bryobacteraceae bacterium]
MLKSEKLKSSPARYARNAREIARCLGLKVKPKQISEIAEWCRREDFPTRTRWGWAVDELRVFFDQITPELALKKFRAQLADPESKLSPSEFNKLVELSAGRVKATTADGKNGGTSELPGLVATPPEIVVGLTRLATWISEVYKIPCSKQSIKNWQKETPPFPAAVSADYRYRWSEVSAWIERYKVKPLAGNSNYADLLVKLEPERIRGELEEIEHDRMMRAVESGQYLKKGDVARACQGIGKTINGVINNRLELRLRVAALERFKLKAETLKAEMLKGDEAVTGFAVELFCELGRETSAALKSELRTALNQLAGADTDSTDLHGATTESAKTI